MRATSSFSEIYLYRAHVDMRKSINGLSQIVAEELKQNPCEGGLFVFVSRDRATRKTLYWDNSGFAIWHKRLEKEKFHWLRSTLEDSLAISYEQLDLLLAGLDIEKVKPHEKLSSPPGALYPRESRCARSPGSQSAGAGWQIECCDQSKSDQHRSDRGHLSLLRDLKKIWGTGNVES